MIKAKEAKNISENGAQIKQIMDDCDRAVRKAAGQGRTSCTVQIRIDSKDDIRDYVRKELTDLGYKVNLGVFRQMPMGCPQEQWGYYDELKITWEGA